MKRQFVYCTVMAAAMTVGLGAQTPSPQDPQSSQPPSTSQEPTRQRPGAQDTGRGQMLTLVGCFQRGDQATTGTSGTANPSTSTRGATASEFVLTDVTQSSSDKPGAAGTSGAASSAQIPSKVNLSASGNSSANWSRYLNHKVEVKGTLLEHPMGGTSPTPSTANPTATPATPPSTTPPSTTPPSTTEPSRPGAGTMSSSDMGATFRVTSIKEVSGTCGASSIK